MLTGKYQEFYEKLTAFIPKERIFHDPLTTLAFGTDASFYRLIPKMVVRAYSSTEVRQIMMAANQMAIPLTFRAAGTSLSGQSISDSVLVVCTHGFRKHAIAPHGERIRLEPGIRGAMAANNASGMCCGTSQNSYKTIADINIILPDGTDLDTSKAESVNVFRRRHADIVEGLEKISKRIMADNTLKERIERKYKIKNTTGYSLNAFVDYSDGIDILKHLMIGSEGTLAFISSITYNTVGRSAT